MFLLTNLLKGAHRIFPAKIVYAHCDIPCGIYDPHMAQLAALTIVRMNQLIEGLDAPTPDSSLEDRSTYVAKLGRFVGTKEHHAELCKQELRILWGDYFTPDHIQQHPDIHDRFHSAMKLASKARQSNDRQAADDLLNAVQGIAEVFWATKGADTSRQPSRHAVGGELVYPS